MLHSRNFKIFKSVAVLGAIGLLTSFGACHGSNDTDGGIASDNLGTGNQPTSDGGFGASLTITLSDGDNIIGTGEREGFFVTALDPSGAPIAFRRVFCDSEQGIAILEPSAGGVAFEHTGADGRLSGVLGGLTPGSFLIECRLEEGFNLVARKSLKIVGDIPEGFSGFPGAAGGHIGGGLVPDLPEGNSALSITVGSGNQVDIVRDLDCNDDNNPPATGVFDVEPFSPDSFTIQVKNGDNNSNFTIDSVTFEVNGVESETNFTSDAIVGPGGTGTITGVYSDLLATSAVNVIKVFHGTDEPLTLGSFNVRFRVRGSSDSGQSSSITETITVQHVDINNCS